jgi:hypothetical protein
MAVGGSYHLLQASKAIAANLCDLPLAKLADQHSKFRPTAPGLFVSNAGAHWMRRARLTSRATIARLVFWPVLSSRSCVPWQIGPWVGVGSAMRDPASSSGSSTILSGSSHSRAANLAPYTGFRQSLFLLATAIFQPARPIVGIHSLRPFGDAYLLRSWESWGVPRQEAY